MCGIFGVLSLDKKFSSTDYYNFIGSTNIVSYRGPDAEGFWSFNTFNKEVSRENFNLFFGHRRLSIIDLSAEGNQPMEIDDCVIIYNGEIFNYIELKNEFLKEEKFLTQSDTEVIIKIYKKFGTLGFDKLNGMWAFLLYDKKNNKLIISRDRFSIKPLYFYQKGNTYYFASEIKQLLRYVDSISPNKKLLYTFITQGVSDYSLETFFENIERIPARRNIIIDCINGLRTNEIYFEYFITQESHNKNEIIEKFKHLFEDSISIRLRSDVQVGCLLSGGLDSSAIASIAGLKTNGSINTYSVVSDNEKFSENKFINILVQQFHLKNTVFNVTKENQLGVINEVISTQDEPFNSLSIAAQFSLFKTIKEHIDLKVVLSGQGGDEVLMGYLKYYFFYLKELSRTFNYFNLIKEVYNSLIKRTALTQFRIDIAKKYIPSLLKNQRDYLLINYAPEATWKFTSLTERQIFDIDYYSTPMMARFEDRNSMHHSIETRHPFLDHRLVNFLLSINTNFKIKNGWLKYILREAITEMPNQIRWRRDKRSFITPEEYWLKNEIKNEIYSNFSKSKLSELDVIDKKMFLNSYESYLSGNKIISYHDILGVFIAELWAKKYFD